MYVFPLYALYVVSHPFSYQAMRACSTYDVHTKHTSYPIPTKIHAAWKKFNTFLLFSILLLRRNIKNRDKQKLCILECRVIENGKTFNCCGPPWHAGRVYKKNTFAYTLRGWCNDMTVWKKKRWWNFYYIQFFPT